MPDNASPDRQRVDKWLWHARMARTRTLAARLVSDGHVRIDSRRVTDPSKKVREGDILTLALAHATIVVEVAGFADRRGSAPEAQRLYNLLSAPAAYPQPYLETDATDAEAARAAPAPAQREGGEGAIPAPIPNPDASDDDDALAPDGNSR